MSDFELHNLCREERVRENHEFSTKMLERHSLPPPRARFSKVPVTFRARNQNIQIEI